MSDIFISYASEDRERVKSLAQALERKGWSVWWDRRIPTGRSFDEVIEEALDASKSVVVVWTPASVKSQWVKAEAREGLRRGVLFPLMLLEEVKIPLEFRGVQIAHLMEWQPEQEHPGFDQFIVDLTHVIGIPAYVEVQPKLVDKSRMDTTLAKPITSQKKKGVKKRAKSQPKDYEYPAIAEIVVQVLASYLRRSPESITESDHLRDDLGLDSVASIELLFEVEERFKLQIPDQDLIKFSTVGSVAAYVQQRLTEAKSNVRG